MEQQYFDYKYVKEIDSNQLQFVIKANDYLLAKFKHIDTDFNELTNQTDVIIWFYQSLTEEEKTSLDSIVDNYTIQTIVIDLPDVSPRQIRLALIEKFGSLQPIEDLLNSLPEPMKSVAKVEWEYSIAFKRTRPLVIQMAAMLGMTSAQVDELWTRAWTL